MALVNARGGLSLWIVLSFEDGEHIGYLRHGRTCFFDRQKTCMNSEMSLQSSALINTSATKRWILGSIAALLAVIVFRQQLIELALRWNAQEEYSHGYFVPLVAAWLLWIRRDVLAAKTGRPAWTGPALVL